MMTPDQFTAILVALTGLVAAVGVVVVQLAAYRRQVNGRLAELLESVAKAAEKQGEMQGRDFMRRLTLGDGPQLMREDPDAPGNIAP